LRVRFLPPVLQVPRRRNASIARGRGVRQRCPGDFRRVIPGEASSMKQNIKSFVSDVGSEMKRVSWPSREQLQESVLVTIATVLAIAVFVYVVDLIFSQIFSLIFR
jgi:preprotein translocase subunit SecE